MKRDLFDEDLPHTKIPQEDRIVLQSALKNLKPRYPGKKK
jgi:hypothetical protein